MNIISPLSYQVLSRNKNTIFKNTQSFHRYGVAIGFIAKCAMECGFKKWFETGGRLKGTFSHISTKSICHGYIHYVPGVVGFAAAIVLLPLSGADSRER